VSLLVSPDSLLVHGVCDPTVPDQPLQLTALVASTLLVAVGPITGQTEPARCSALLLVLSSEERRCRVDVVHLINTVSLQEV